MADAETTKKGAQPKSIDIPLADPNVTPVRVTGEADLPDGTRCPTGAICARGEIPLPGGESLKEVRAYVYHTDPGDDVDGCPHPDAVSFKPTDPSDGRYWFDHEEGHKEIGGVRCEANEPYRNDNWLVVWAQWVSFKEDGKTSWPHVEGPVQVRGKCSDKTECQGGTA